MGMTEESEYAMIRGFLCNRGVQAFTEPGVILTKRKDRDECRSKVVGSKLTLRPTLQTHTHVMCVSFSPQSLKIKQQKSQGRLVRMGIINFLIKSKTDIID